MINLGWLSDLLGVLLYRDGVAQASRRAWNLSSRFIASDSPADGWTEIDIDAGALAAQTVSAPEPVTRSTGSVGSSSATLARSDHEHALGADPNNTERRALALQYDASGVTSGPAVGFEIDQAVAPGGSASSVLLDLRSAGTSQIKVLGGNSGGVEIRAAGKLTASNPTTGHEGDLIPTGAGAWLDVLESDRDTATSPGGVSFALETPSGYAEFIDAVIVSYDSSGANAAVTVLQILSAYDGSTYEVTEIYRDTGGVDADSVSVSGGSAINIELTNNHAGSKTYTAHFRRRQTDMGI